MTRGFPVLLRAGLAGTLAAACGSGSGAGAATGDGGGAGGAPPPTVFAGVQVGPGALAGIDDATVCHTQTDSTWQLGSYQSPQPVGIPVGSPTYKDLYATCNVDPDGAAFDVQLTMRFSGGMLSVSGKVASSGTSTGLNAIFGVNGAEFTGSDCTFTQTYVMMPLPAGGQPAPGRIWGHIDCPAATFASEACDASADFLFENCQ